MVARARIIEAAVSAGGLQIDGHGFDQKTSIGRYIEALGPPDRTVVPGPPAPVGHRNNQVHFFDWAGLYLTEHHASRLIESVNFVLDQKDSPFSIDQPFAGGVLVGARRIDSETKVEDLDLELFARDLPGEYSMRFDVCRVHLSAKRRRGSGGKRKGPAYVSLISVSFG